MHQTSNVMEPLEVESGAPAGPLAQSGAWGKRAKAGSILVCGVVVGVVATRVLTGSSPSVVSVSDGTMQAMLGGSVGGSVDAHSCQSSAGMTWCESRHTCVRSWEDSCPGGVDHCKAHCKEHPNGLESVSCACIDGVAIDYNPPKCGTWVSRLESTASNAVEIAFQRRTAEVEILHVQLAKLREHADKMVKVYGQVTGMRAQVLQAQMKQLEVVWDIFKHLPASKQAVVFDHLEALQKTMEQQVVLYEAQGKKIAELHANIANIGNSGPTTIPRARQLNAAEGWGQHDNVESRDQFAEELQKVYGHQWDLQMSQYDLLLKFWNMALEAATVSVNRQAEQDAQAFTALRSALDLGVGVMHGVCVTASQVGRSHSVEGDAGLLAARLARCEDDCLTPCQRTRAQQARSARIGAFMPRCEKEGHFSRIQCHGSTGHCWCVDRTGAKLEEQSADCASLE